MTAFQKPKAEVIGAYKRRMDTALGKTRSKPIISGLLDLGYLPLHIKALPEGTICPLRVPMLTITNTHKDFAWLPNFLETILSNVLWHPTTAATIAFQYRKLLSRYDKETSDITGFRGKWQARLLHERAEVRHESSC